MTAFSSREEDLDWGLVVDFRGFGGNFYEAVGAGEGGEIAGALPGDDLDLGDLAGWLAEVAVGGQKAGEAGFAAPVACELGEGEARLGAHVSAKRGEDGRGEEVEGDGAGDGVAGERENCQWGLARTGNFGEDDGFAGLDGDSAEEEAGAGAGEGIIDEVETAG